MPLPPILWATRGMFLVHPSICAQVCTCEFHDPNKTAKLKGVNIDAIPTLISVSGRKLEIVITK